MTSETIKQVKASATEVVRSHGAFGESERYYEINPDKLIEEVMQYLERVCMEEDAVYLRLQRNTFDFDEKNIFNEGRAGVNIVLRKMRNLFPKPETKT